MGARGVNFHYDVFARMGYEAEAKQIQDLYLAGDKKGAIAAVPTGSSRTSPWSAPGPRSPTSSTRWQDTILTTFSINCDPRHLEKIAELVS